MGLFDKIVNNTASSLTGSVNKAAHNLGNKAQAAAKSAASHIGNKTEKIVFKALPTDFEGFKALPQAAMLNPFDTAAMAVLAFCFFPKDNELCYEMIDFLRGPRQMNGMDKQFIADRFRAKDYVPRSYFEGATPKNDYTPSQPYTVYVSEASVSDDQPNMMKLFIASGGADSPRPVTLREAKDGKWYLWEYSSILLDIRQPESSNPWA